LPDVLIRHDDRQLDTTNFVKNELRNDADGDPLSAFPAETVPSPTIDAEPAHSSITNEIAYDRFVPIASEQRSPPLNEAGSEGETPYDALFTMTPGVGRHERAGRRGSMGRSLGLSLVSFCLGIAVAGWLGLPEMTRSSALQWTMQLPFVGRVVHLTSTHAGPVGPLPARTLSPSTPIAIPESERSGFFRSDIVERSESQGGVNIKALTGTGEAPRAVKTTDNAGGGTRRWPDVTPSLTARNPRANGPLAPRGAGETAPPGADTPVLGMRESTNPPTVTSRLSNGAATASEEGVVRHVLDLYKAAYDASDLAAMSQIWPSVSREQFANARSQGLVFDRCDASLEAFVAVVYCQGSVGDGRRVGKATSHNEPYHWLFRLRKHDTEWKIEKVVATHRAAR
jgi:hypothetical protein